MCTVGRGGLENAEEGRRAEEADCNRREGGQQSQFEDFLLNTMVSEVL